MAVAVDSSRTEKDVPDALAELLRTLTNASTIRRLAFNSFKDLHAFQLAVTGFDVKFDGYVSFPSKPMQEPANRQRTTLTLHRIASTFSISRRRMVVPIYKQWTANTIRLQIVHQDNVIQLLAFFEDFSHADAMNFRLSSMDTFEKKDSGGKFGLKLVDAKFALPVDQRRGEGKMQKAEGRVSGWVGVKRRFVCLDEIEYPGEHDDILIMFDSAECKSNPRFLEQSSHTDQSSARYLRRRPARSHYGAQIHRPPQDLITHTPFLSSLHPFASAQPPLSKRRDPQSQHFFFPFVTFHSYTTKHHHLGSGPSLLLEVRTIPNTGVLGRVVLCCCL